MQDIYADLQWRGLIHQTTDTEALMFLGTNGHIHQQLADLLDLGAAKTQSKGSSRQGAKDAKADNHG